MIFARISILGALVLMPLHAWAMQKTVWSFEGGAIPGQWEVMGLSPHPEKSPGGLRIQTKSDGQLMRAVDVPHPIEAVTLTLRKAFPGEGLLLWHISGSPIGEHVQLPFTIIGGSEREIIPFNMNYYGQWDSLTDKIGFAFPTETNLTIESIELQRWNIFEKTWEMTKSFWTFDGMRPYTINFLWGPRLARNPIEHLKLFRIIPPMGLSANLAFYVFLGLAAFVCLLLAKGKITVFGKKPLALFVITGAFLWILYDVRMGLEIAAYAKHDLKEFSLPKDSEKRFRERSDFHAFIESVRPYVRDRDRYVFLSSYRWPFFGTARYETYPSIPTDPVQGMHGVDTWVVYDRPEITLNGNGALLLEGAAVSLPGKKIYEWSPSSFVFRIGT